MIVTTRRAVFDVTFGVLAHGRPPDSLSFEPTARRHERRRRRAHARDRPRLSLLLAATHVRRSDSMIISYLPYTKRAVIARTGNPADRRGRAAFTPTICGGGGG